MESDGIESRSPSIRSELEWEWGVTSVQDAENQSVRTLADDLESALQIAHDELNELVAADPEIRRREP